MKISQIKPPHTATSVAMQFSLRVRESRFTAEVDTRASDVIILSVRLRERKLYCGNHPKACERTGGGKHRRLAFLEGADWVEFDDMINDLLDELNVDCNVNSRDCVLRSAGRRRVCYTASNQFANGTWIWDKKGEEEHYSDLRGLPPPYPPSEFPIGTPGIHTRAKYFCVGAHDH